MNKSKLLLALAFAATTPCGATTIDLSQWRYVADVAVENGTAEFASLTLTPEIYNSAAEDMADLRLIGADENQIPYIVIRSEEQSQTIQYNPAVLNRVVDAHGNVLATIDFYQQTIKNSIEVETSSDNFRRAVRVEGSNDNVQFFTIVERAFIFAVGDSYHHRFSRIDLPDNDYRYIRVTVSPMAVEETRLAINDVRAFKTEKLAVLKQTIAMTLIEHGEDEKTNKSSYIYDLQFHGLGVIEIELDVADDSFYRYVSIWGRDSETEQVKLDSEDNRQRFTEIEVPWKSITAEAIYRYVDTAGRRQQRLVLPIESGCHYRYVKIVVNNYDDSPIEILSASARMIPHRIIFPVPESGSAKLYIGCAHAGRPQYDLTHRLTDPTKVETAAAIYASLMENPDFVEKEQKVPWTEQHKILLLSVLAVIVVVLGAIIIRSIRAIQKQQGDR